MTSQRNQSLEMALEALLMDTLTQLPAESELSGAHSFSARFERRMTRLIRKARRSDLTRRQAAAQTTPMVHRSSRLKRRMLAAAIVLAILISLFSVSAAREAVVKFFVEVYDTFTAIIFDKNQSPTDSTASTATIDPVDLPAMLPAYIPDGYELTDMQMTDSFLHASYMNDQNDIISYTIQKHDTTQLLIDTENSMAEEIAVGAFSGFIYSNKGALTVVWQQGIFVGTISGNIDKVELINMAVSTN